MTPLRYPLPLVRGTLTRRYKRFLADVVLDDGRVVVAHCANSGSMAGLCAPGSEVWLSPAEAAGRKLLYTWELVRADGTLVGINTGRPNALVAEAIAAGAIPELLGYAAVRREVKYGVNSRIDLLLEGNGRPCCYVEVKSVTMRRDPAGPAEFPDAVTARGAKHLRELAAMAAAGARAVMLFLVQRADCTSFALAGDIDPLYAAAFRSASQAGVEALCYACRVDPEGIEVAQSLPLEVEVRYPWSRGQKVLS